jgi:uncharacterized membrane protein YebE (DUF533 family)
MRRPCPKKANDVDDVAHSIEQVERRIELRRARVVRHTDALREAAERRAKALALAGIGVVAAAGFVLGRRPGSASAGRFAGTAAKTGALAAVVAVAQTAIRVAMNPLVRSAWNSYMRKRV